MWWWWGMLGSWCCLAIIDSSCQGRWPACLPTCLPARPPACLPGCLAVCLPPALLPAWLPGCLPARLPACPPACPPTCPPTCLPGLAGDLLALTCWCPCRIWRLDSGEYAEVADRIMTAWELRCQQVAAEGAGVPAPPRPILMHSNLESAGEILSVGGQGSCFYQPLPASLPFACLILHLGCFVYGLSPPLYV